MQNNEISKMCDLLFAIGNLYDAFEQIRHVCMNREGEHERVLTYQISKTYPSCSMDRMKFMCACVCCRNEPFALIFVSLFTFFFSLLHSHFHCCTLYTACRRKICVCALHYIFQVGKLH